jgi:hypothetical protein
LPTYGRKGIHKTPRQSDGKRARDKERQKPRHGTLKRASYGYLEAYQAEDVCKNRQGDIG